MDFNDGFVCVCVQEHFGESWSHKKCKDVRSFSPKQNLLSVPLLFHL